MVKWPSRSLGLTESKIHKAKNMNTQKIFMSHVNRKVGSTAGVAPCCGLKTQKTGFLYRSFQKESF